jgi:hypothetical protein
MRPSTAQLGDKRIFITLSVTLILATARSCLGQATEVAPRNPKPAVDELIPWLLQEDMQLRGIPFSEVISDTTGRRVIAFNPSDETDARVLKLIRAALDEAIVRLSAPDSVIQTIPWINEVSSHFEDLLPELLNAAPGLQCDFPKTADERMQRSGYPDLRLVEQQNQRVYYLDPKLYAADSRDSSFRTFYFEPKIATNKVRDDAVYFIIGFEHEKKLPGGGWKFTRWDLVDLSRFRVKLKAEFQGSNHDMYRPEAIVATSAREPSF